MDARLVEMVEPALGIRRGDAVVLRNAGNIIGTLEGTMIISLLVAVFMQNIEEIIVVGHEDCGFTHASSAVLLDKMRDAASARKPWKPCAALWKPTWIRTPIRNKMSAAWCNCSAPTRPFRRTSWCTAC